MLLFSKVDKQHLFLFWNGAKTKEEKKRTQRWKRHNIANHYEEEKKPIEIRRKKNKHTLYKERRLEKEFSLSSW
jgi:hypothetical protein